MRLLPLLVLTGCGNIHALGNFDTADTADTGAADDTDTSVDSDTQQDTDTGPADTDTGPADTREGVYNGTFVMNVAMAGLPIPIDTCTGTAQIVVTTSTASGAFDCPFTGFLGQTIGTQTGEVTAGVSGTSVVDPYATMGLFFVFDELSGSFQGNNALLLSEAGTVSIELGDYDYTAEFDVRK